MNYRPLFIGASVIASLWLLHCVAAGMVFTYSFLFINIFLAVIPLLVEPIFPFLKQKTRGSIRVISYILVGALWLLFLPNAFYILTDFMHLNSSVLVNMPGDSYRSAITYVRGDAIFMLDSLLIFCAVVFGAYAGGLALFHAYTVIRRGLNKKAAIVLVSLIMLLSSIGIFIGRFGRWNSWDALYQPWVIFEDLYYQLFTLGLFGRFAIVVLTAFIFHMLCFYVVSTLQKRQRS